MIHALFSPDGTRILTVSRDRTSRLWSIDGQLLGVLRGHEGIVWDGVFSKDGDRVYTASFDGTVRTWFVDEQELLDTARLRAFRPFTEDERHRYKELLGR